MDRIDLFVHLPSSSAMVYSEEPDGPPSGEVRARVVAARARQLAREGNGGEPNGRLQPKALREVAELGADARALLRSAAERMSLSARAMTRIVRVARTIADIEGEPAVSLAHVAEAIGYRSFGGS
jgi:magnesium chelatase family protein